jgi:hypothetical protein
LCSRLSGLSGLSTKGVSFPGTMRAAGPGLTGLPCAEGDLAVRLSTGCVTREKLSTGCAKDLWTPEVIIPNRAHGGMPGEEFLCQTLCRLTFEWKRVTPEDGGQETGGRRVTWAPVDEVGARRVICRLKGVSLSTCPQVEKLTCG